MPRQKIKEIDDSKIKILHTMADGKIRKKIDGYTVPYNDVTVIFYDILSRFNTGNT